MLRQSPPQTVWLAPGAAVETDVARFRRAAGAGSAGWRQAAELYRGDFLQDLFLADSDAFEEWAAAERADLRRTMQEMIAGLTAACMEQAAWPEAERYARRRLALDNLSEVAQRQVIEILAQSGQRSEALAHYRRFRTALAAELGVTPSAELEALAAALQDGALPPRRAAFPLAAGAPAPAQPPHNLHPPATPLIGREAELGALAQMLRGHPLRLLTIVGPGGIGKSRLALAFAQQARQDNRSLMLRSTS